MTALGNSMSGPSLPGLLGKASVLAVTLYPDRTSPTIRAKWLLENILAAPVPPPPPIRISISMRTRLLSELSATSACPLTATNARTRVLEFGLDREDCIG